MTEADIIKQQLDSILAQDEKDIHILVSDDCSADGSGELLKEYEERHRDRILVLFRRKPSGGAAAHSETLQADGGCRP
ncbi:MAG: glycosyltransferase [Enterocloster clostridioformis]